MHESAIKSDINFRLQLRVNEHAFYSFRVRNHAGMGPLGHFIIATAPLYSEMTKEFLLLGAPSGPLEVGALSF